MTQATAIGARDEAEAREIARDLSNLLGNVRIVGPVQRVEANSDPANDTWLVIGTDATFKVV